jgi:uncharacterized protein (DUF362 family)
MTKITRRDFLKAVLGVTGAVALSPVLSSCTSKGEQSVNETLPRSFSEEAPSSIQAPASTPSSMPPTPQPSGQESGNPAATSTKSQPTQTPVEGASEPAQAAQSVADLSVARGGEPEELVRRAMLALGGMERFVSRGDWVILKPNLCAGYNSYEYAATTNPWVMGALVRMCLEAGADKVQVMDFPFGGSAQNVYKRSGVQEEVEAAGGEMVLMSPIKYVKTPIPAGTNIHEWVFYEDIFKADVVINVPIAKHHGLARLTLGMKNLMGVVLDREGLHRNLGQRLADITSVVRPTLTVIDAVRILTNNGPTGGSLSDVQKLDTIIASPDIVAADSYATRLFNLKPEDITYIQAGATMGLGISDLSQLTIAEV